MFFVSTSQKGNHYMVYNGKAVVPVPSIHDTITLAPKLVSNVSLVLVPQQRPVWIFTIILPTAFFPKERALIDMLSC